ncbi:MAG TPA: DUF4337 domain-containing protein [Acidobacteriaceae bacterium]
MEPNEVQELQEQHEHANEPPEGEGRKLAEEVAHGGLKPISFTMSVLAVLVAVVTVLGHRTHTEAVLMQARASDQWNFYQAKKIRQNDTLLTQDLLGAVTVRDPAAAAKILEGYKSHQDKWAEDLNEEQAKAKEFEEAVEHAEHKATRFDLSEALLEIGLVVTSITLLTRQRIYWVLGMLFGAIGLVVAGQGLLLH